jgi:hypothetical protein
MAEVDARRYLCSDLVVLKTAGGDVTVNLEEIWESGAVLEAEQAFDDSSRVVMRGGGHGFSGRVLSCSRHEFGWRVELEFSPLTPWNPARFLPQHLTDPSGLK